SALESLSGLEGLASVGGGLGIGSNDALTSLSGLEGLTSVGGELGIANNAVLPQCEAATLDARLRPTCSTGRECYLEGNNGTGTCQCGDDVQNLGEGCDDGNIIPGDGCSDVCAVE
ncbi:MAG: hypothetical protein ACO3JL_18375, partial [Myxococcota bacterium]